MKNFITVALAILLSICFAFAQESKDIKLPEPHKSGGKTLAEALTLRSSAREFSSQELSLQELSDLLWSADGINRPESGKRTAPTAMNKQDTDIFVILRSGIYLYSPKDNKLILRREGNYMKIAGKQPYVENAALNLVYVSNLAKMNDADEKEKILFAGVHAGCISQNVYLFCAVAGLNTVTRRSIDTVSLAAALELTKDEIIVLAQTVGYKP